MKKLFITLAIIVAVIVAVPFLGNKVVESSIEDRVEVLNSYGLKVKKVTTDFSYLSTKKHLIFAVEDTQKFVAYLNQFSDAQLPAYIDALVDGAEVGLDIKYSNIAFSDALSIDIYPNTLPSKIAADIKKEDADLFTYIDTLLKDKAILYHINYDIINDAFDGYIKDLDKSYSLKNKTKISLLLKGTSFYGEGLVIAPDTLSSKIDTLKLSLEDIDESILIDLSGFTSSSVFESKTTYATTVKFDKVSWSAKSIDVPNVSLDMTNLSFDFSSNAQDIKADFYTKTSFDTLSLNTAQVTINTQKFNYDLALRGVDKEEYIKLLTLISKAKASPSQSLEKEINITMLDLVAKGFVVDVADFSIKELSTLKTTNLGGLSIKAKLIVKEDKNLANKMKTNQMSIIQNMDLDLNFIISELMYTKLAMLSPALSMAQGFAQRVKENFVFDIKLKDSKLSVNGKTVN